MQTRRGRPIGPEGPMTAIYARLPVSLLARLQWACEIRGLTMNAALTAAIAAWVPTVEEMSGEKALLDRVRIIEEETRGQRLHTWALTDSALDDDFSADGDDPIRPTTPTGRARLLAECGWKAAEAKAAVEKAESEEHWRKIAVQARLWSGKEWLKEWSEEDKEVLRGLKIRV